ncbi:MAG: four helix bundle protein [Bacteroidetes bacterium]|nr:MAG: four helix bundle protein [Bacteroidota bacterium]
MAQVVYDLENRLIEFAAAVVETSEALPMSKAGVYVAGQMLRSGMAPAMLYGEAQGAESRSDFIHKMKLVLKELKETRVSMKLVIRLKMRNLDDALAALCSENEALIAIVAKSIDTAKSNLAKEQRAARNSSS